MTLLQKPHASGTYVKHVEEDVELDDGLSADDVVHHRDVDVVHHKTADDENDAFQQITDLSSVQQTSACRPTARQTYCAAYVTAAAKTTKNNCYQIVNICGVY